jgi:hypothetical protein
VGKGVKEVGRRVRRRETRERERRRGKCAGGILQFM